MSAIYRARANKVRAIVALVPPAANQAEADALATVLQNLDDSDRLCFSEAATGSKRAPSDLTWHLVVKAVRSQLTDKQMARGAA